MTLKPQCVEEVELGVSGRGEEAGAEGGLPGAWAGWGVRSLPQSLCALEVRRKDCWALGFGRVPGPYGVAQKPRVSSWCKADYGVSWQPNSRGIF